VQVFTTDEGKSDPALLLRGPVVSLGFCLPPTSRESTARTYQVNAVYRRQVELEANSETDDDEAILEDG
jgi:hypothetical protein